MKISKRLVRIAQSFGVIIDKPILKKLGLNQGDWIEIDIRKLK